MRMGIPQVVVSDQGREFNNALNDELAVTLGISRRLTTPYHPQVLKVLLSYIFGPSKAEGTLFQEKESSGVTTLILVCLPTIHLGTI